MFTIFSKDARLLIFRSNSYSHSLLAIQPVPSKTFSTVEKLLRLFWCTSNTGRNAVQTILTEILQNLIAIPKSLSLVIYLFIYFQSGWLAQCLDYKLGHVFNLLNFGCILDMVNESYGNSLHPFMLWSTPWKICIDLWYEVGQRIISLKWQLLSLVRLNSKSSWGLIGLPIGLFLWL